MENPPNPPSVYSSFRPRFEVNISRIQIQKDYRYPVTLSTDPYNKRSLRTFKKRLEESVALE
jgi:hypothetical protein